MATIHINDTDYKRLEADVWEMVRDADFLPSWWVKWEATPSGRLSVAAHDEYENTVTRRTFTKRQLVAAYVAGLGNDGSMTHCGGYDILAEPDACGPDLLLQNAIFGEVKFG